MGYIKSPNHPASRQHLPCARCNTNARRVYDNGRASSYCFECEKARFKIRDEARKSPEYNAYMQRYHRLKYYGLTPDEFDRLLEAQHSKCAICATVLVMQKGGYGLAVDHNHKTGKVRGLLCGNCNMGIGYLQESPQLLFNAYSYLEPESPTALWAC